MSKILLGLLLSTLALVACDSEQKNQSTTAIEKAPLITSPVVDKEVVTEVDVKTEIVGIADEAKSEIKVSMSGEQVYKKSCQSCHASGAAGAPKLGDIVAWKPRVDKGLEALYSSALKGVPGTAMMVKGTCATCSEEELRATVDYMVSKVK